MQKGGKSDWTECAIFSNVNGMNMLREFEIVWLTIGFGGGEQKLRVENSTGGRLRKVSV